jgi:hypothetical protein
MHLEFVAFEGLAQVAFELHPLDDGSVSAR